MRIGNHQVVWATILLAARGLLAEAQPLIRKRGLTLVGIAVTNIEPAGTGPAGDYKIEKKSWEYAHNLAHVANTVSFAVEQRAPGDLVEVWASEDPLTLASGASVDVFAQATDPFIGALTPVEGVDYTLASGTVTVALSRTSGQSTIVTVTASADAGDPPVATRRGGNRWTASAGANASARPQ